MQFSNYVNGEFVQADEGKTLNHIDPSTGEVDSTLPDSDVMDVVFAVQAANKALQVKMKMTAAEAQAAQEQKAVVLERIASEIEKRGRDFALAQARDVGIPTHSSETYSIARAAGEFRFHANLLRSRTEPYLPMGIVAVITPASDPLVNLAARIAPALATGNAVIAKPSQSTPETAELLARVIHECELVPGLFALLQGRGDQVGVTLTKHPGIAAIAFIGSSETGRAVQQVAAEVLKRTHLALGARNPVILFNGVDLQKVIPQIAQASLGQHPSFALRGSRLFIQEAIYKEALELLKSEISKIKIGDPLAPSTRLGPLANQKYFDRYQSILELASKQNGKTSMGGVGRSAAANGKHARGFFVNPTLIFDLTNCSTLQQEEIVGPFINATSFKYQHEAIRHANTSPYGHAAYIFENDGEKALRVASQLEVGRVFLNSVPSVVDFQQECEDFKSSGLGRTGGATLFDFFSRRIAFFAQTIS